MPSPTCCREDLAALLQAELFKSLADPVRLQVVERLALATEPKTVTDVQECCGVHLSGVSRHLRQLREVGVVRAEKQGREVRYSLRRAELVRRLRALADALEGVAPDEPADEAPPTPGGDER